MGKGTTGYSERKTQRGAGGTKNLEDGSQLRQATENLGLEQSEKNQQKVVDTQKEQGCRH